jgi:hypothetical protein
MTTENFSAKPAGPSWLAKPCPEWCAANHREKDLVDDRMHWSDWLQYVPLPVATPVTVGDPPERRQRVLVVYVEQHVDEDQPRVVLTEEHGKQEELRLTAEDACQLGSALLHGRIIITDDPSTKARRG